MPPNTDTQPVAVAVPLTVELDWIGRVADAESRSLYFDAYRYAVRERVTLDLSGEPYRVDVITLYAGSGSVPDRVHVWLRRITRREGRDFAKHRGTRVISRASSDCASVVALWARIDATFYRPAENVYPPDGTGHAAAAWKLTGETFGSIMPQVAGHRTCPRNCDRHPGGYVPGVSVFGTMRPLPEAIRLAARALSAAQWADRDSDAQGARFAADMREFGAALLSAATWSARPDGHGRPVTFAEGERVGLGAHTDYWMQGRRYGTVIEVDGDDVRVSMPAPLSDVPTARLRRWLHSRDLVKLTVDGRPVGDLR